MPAAPMPPNTAAARRRRAATTEAVRRVCVIGTSGSGKTTLAGQLGRRVGVPHIEMDALRHGPNWTETPDDEMLARLAFLLDQADRAHGGWVTDGNYGFTRPLLWSRADTVVYLDYWLPVVLRQLFGRTVRRVFTQQELWNGNRERFVNAFASRDSLFLWVLQTYKRRRREYPELFARPENAHLRVVHLRSPRETRRWLATVPLPPTNPGG